VGNVSSLGRGGDGGEGAQGDGELQHREQNSPNEPIRLLTRNHKRITLETIVVVITGAVERLIFSSAPFAAFIVRLLFPSLGLWWGARAALRRLHLSCRAHRNSRPPLIIFTIYFWPAPVITITNIIKRALALKHAMQLASMSTNCLCTRK
jgi:uncharacterized membrane protein YcfT